MAIIEVNHITKEYKLGQLESIKLSLQRLIARMNGHSLPERPNFKALDDVDFKVEQGEVLGIIGSNGAGKSTLLKVLSRITVPSQGSVKVQGKVAPLIEVGAGLVWDMTGRENIYLNAAILGMTKKEITRKFDEIVAFSELEEFLDTPIKRYSSGMSIRLAFSIATSVDADILIVDEVLAVGDLAFQRKCFDRMEDMIKRQKKTVLLVSHNIRQVERLCTRVMLLDRGRILSDGKATDVCNLFYERSDEKIKNDAVQGSHQLKALQTTGELELMDVHILNNDDKQVTNIAYGADITIMVRYKANVEIPKPHFGIGVHTTDFIYLVTDHSEEKMYALQMSPGIYEVKCKIRQFPLLPGIYALRLGVALGELVTPIFYVENALFFQVMARDGKRTQAMQEGFLAWESEWFVARIAKDESMAIELRDKTLASS